MKAEELMIGDWVMTAIKNMKNRQMKVVCIEQGFVSIADELVEIRLKPHQIEPIPLTPKILEKNGFMTGDKGRGYMGYMMYFLYDDEDHCLFGVKWYIEKSMAEISLETTPYYIIIKHVHQLQHALKICGINREIVL